MNFQDIGLYYSTTTYYANQYVCLALPVGAYPSLLVPALHCWCQLFPVGACSPPSVPALLCWCLLFFVGACPPLLVPALPCWCLLSPVGACSPLLVPALPCWCLLSPVSACSPLLVFNGKFRQMLPSHIISQSSSSLSAHCRAKVAPSWYHLLLSCAVLTHVMLTNFTMSSLHQVFCHP